MTQHKQVLICVVSSTLNQGSISTYMYNWVKLLCATVYGIYTRLLSYMTGFMTGCMTPSDIIPLQIPAWDSWMEDRLTCDLTHKQFVEPNS